MNMTDALAAAAWALIWADAQNWKVTEPAYISVGLYGEVAFAKFQMTTLQQVETWAEYLGCGVKSEPEENGGRAFILHQFDYRMTDRDANLNFYSVEYIEG